MKGNARGLSGSTPDTNAILHIASYASVSTLYEQMFYAMSRYKIAQKVFVPCNSADKGGYKLKHAPEGSNIEMVTSVVSNPLSRLLFFPKTEKHYDRLLKSFPIDKIGFVFAHTLLTDGVLAYKLFKKYKIPYTITVQKTDMHIFLKKMPFLSPLSKKIMRSAEKIILVNGAYEGHLLEYYKNDPELCREIREKAILIPYGVEDYWIKNKVVSPKTLTDNKRIKCLFAGRLMKYKNIEGAIKSILKLNQEGYEATLTIVGGRYNAYEMVAEYASAYPNQIKYLGGPYNRDELRQIYHEHDIFIMPSFNESFGLVYIEAMSQGTPVIYSEKEGIYGIFEEGTVGFGPAPRSLDEITDAIKRIVGNYTTMSDNCIKKTDHFSWDVIVPGYLDISNAATKLTETRLVS